jgi:hypothetical protein
MFLAEGFGWDHRVPGWTILDVIEAGRDFRNTGVVIRYRHRTGDLELLELNVADRAGLVKALREIRRH